MPEAPLNFLFINTDQQRLDSLGCYGCRVEAWHRLRLTLTDRFG